MNDHIITDNLQGKEEEKKHTARSRDLATRERVNFVLSSELMEQLRGKSSKEQVPMSRIIDTALQSYLSMSTPSAPKASLETGIILSHFFELLLLFSYQLTLTQTIADMLTAHFENFIYSRCIFKNTGSSPVVGTKFLLFISDEDNDKFVCLLSDLHKLAEGENSKNICLLLDGKPISCDIL